MAPANVDKRYQGARRITTSADTYNANTRLQEILAYSLATLFLVDAQTRQPESSDALFDICGSMAVVVGDMVTAGLLVDEKSVTYFYRGILLPKIQMLTTDVWKPVLNPLAAAAVEMSLLVTHALIQGKGTSPQRSADEDTRH
jgi:hypothetical protein